MLPNVPSIYDFETERSNVLKCIAVIGKLPTSSKIPLLIFLLPSLGTIEFSSDISIALFPYPKIF
jgi:hypothetical protein